MMFPKNIAVAKHQECLTASAYSSTGSQANGRNSVCLVIPSRNFREKPVCVKTPRPLNRVPTSRRSKREVHPEFQIIGVILCLILITILR